MGVVMYLSPPSQKMVTTVPLVRPLATLRPASYAAPED